MSLRSDPDGRMVRLAYQVRGALETLWPGWHRARGTPIPAVKSAGTCQTSSLFLATCLQEAGWPAQVEQGNGLGQHEGYFHAGQWHGHAWVLCDGWIIDVTADQFDALPVQIVRPGDPRYHSGPVDTASAAARAARQHRVTEAMPLWRAGRPVRAAPP